MHLEFAGNRFQRCAVASKKLFVVSPKKPINPALKDLIDTCLVPILVKKYLEESKSEDEEAA
jgi:hypothetical protein